jgi:signal transduction histidine kinase
MRINVHVHHHYDGLAAVLAKLQTLEDLIKMSQEEFDEKMRLLNEKLDGIGESVTAAATAIEEVRQAVISEGQQIRDFIAAHPDLDTSALDGIVSRLDNVSSSLSNQVNDLSGLDTSVGEIFTPPEPEGGEPAAEATAEEAPVGEAAESDAATAGGGSE